MMSSIVIYHRQPAPMYSKRLCILYGRYKQNGTSFICLFPVKAEYFRGETPPPPPPPSHPHIPPTYHTPPPATPLFNKVEPKHRHYENLRLLYYLQ